MIAFRHESLRQFFAASHLRERIENQGVWPGEMPELSTSTMLAQILRQPDGFLLRFVRNSQLAVALCLRGVGRQHVHPTTSSNLERFLTAWTQSGKASAEEVYPTLDVLLEFWPRSVHAFYKRLKRDKDRFDRVAGLIADDVSDFCFIMRELEVSSRCEAIAVRGAIECIRGHEREAETLLLKALHLADDACATASDAQRMIWQRMIGRLCSQLGGIALATGSSFDAAHWFEHSKKLACANGDPWGEAYALNRLCEVEQSRGDTRRAFYYLKASRATWRRMKGSHRQRRERLALSLGSLGSLRLHVVLQQIDSGSTRPEIYQSICRTEHTLRRALALSGSRLLRGLVRLRLGICYRLKYRQLQILDGVRSSQSIDKARDDAMHFLHEGLRDLFATCHYRGGVDACVQLSSLFDALDQPDHVVKAVAFLRAAIFLRRQVQGSVPEEPSPALSSLHAALVKAGSVSLFDEAMQMTGKDRYPQIPEAGKIGRLIGHSLTH